MADAHEAPRPLFSVVMIFLDAERFIEEAIRSVFDQTYAHWELLLVDDGSSDRSTAIARDCAQLHAHRVRYLEHANHANRGTGPSRNLGLEQAGGDYIAFLDADDIYLPDRLKRHIEAFLSHPGLGVVISHDLYWHSWQSTSAASIERDQILGPAVPTNVVMEPPDLLTITLSARGTVVPGVCSFSFQRELVASGCRIPSKFVDHYEDQALYAQLLLRGQVVVLDACLAKYRQHGGSLTHRARERGEYRPGRAHHARFIYLLWLQGHVSEQSVRSVELDAALHRQLWPMRHPLANSVYEALADCSRWAKRAAHMVGNALLPPSIANGLTHWYLRRQHSSAARRVQRAAEQVRQRARRAP